jgi:siroheme synthase
MSPSTRVILVENASLPTSRRIGCTLRGLRNGAARQLTGPALLLFGDVFRKRGLALDVSESMARDTPLQATRS